MRPAQTITLVTPVRDEIENLPRLYSSIAAQTVPIERWIICQNGSVDGSIEFLETTPRPDNVKDLVVLNIDVADQAYALGFTYSRIVNRGFSEAVTNYGATSFIGILDADCFPTSKYYETLISEFSARPRLGILSGRLVDDDGVFLPRAKGFPRGNCRLWSRGCFDEAGYVVGMSADALSAIKAQSYGWDVDNLDDAFVIAREIGARAGQKYYGQSSYYRGETAAFAAIKSVGIARRSPVKAWQFAYGYFSSMLLKSPRTTDPDILKYSKRKLFSKFKAVSPW